MNSLEQLNSFSSEPVDYGDQADYSITFSGSNVANITVNEGQSHSTPVGWNIATLVSAPNTLNLTYNVSNATGANVTWASLPAGVTVTNPSTGVYKVNNVNTLTKWNAVKTATVNIPRDFATNYTYTGSINDEQGNVRTWTTTVTMNNGSELNTLTPGTVVYNEDEQVSFGANIIQITDSENPTGTYILTGNMSNNDAGTLASTYSASGLTVTFVAGTLTLTGAKGLINTYLNSLYFNPTMDFASNFTIVWTLTNPTGLQTVANQSVNIGNSNTEVINESLTRTYVQNGYALLCPTNPIEIVEGIGGTYTIQLQLAADIGVIGLGESFSAPVNWSASTRTYSFTGTQAQCNTILATIRFFPYVGQSGTTTVTYRQSRNGTQQVSQNFSLVGSVVPGVITGGTGPITLAEDSDNNSLGLFSIFPNWQENYTIGIFNQRGNVTVNDIGIWQEPSVGANGWITINNPTAQLQNGIYKVYTAAANVSQHSSNLTEVNDIVLSLKPDYNTAFQIKQVLGIGSYWDGANLTVAGGTQYTATKTATVSASDEYTLTTSYTYAEDAAFGTLAFEVTDSDTTNVSSWNVQFKQISPDYATNPGWWNTNTGPVFANAISYSSGSKPNSTVFPVTYSAPLDYAGTVVLGYTQYKLTQSPTANILQANNVSITATCTATNSETDITTAYNYSEDTLLTLTHNIPADGVGTNRVISWTQVTPDPTAGASNVGRFILDGNLVANTTSTGNITDTTYQASNARLVQYVPPPDYTGTILLRYNQWKYVPDGGPSIQQAANTLVTMTCQATHTDVTVPGVIQPFINSTTAIPGITINDLQASSLVPKTYTVTITPAVVYGTFASGATNYGNTVSLSGSKATINAALANLTYTTTQSANVTTTASIVITRTAPDNTVLHNANSQLQIIGPVVGEAWRGGYYAGTIADPNTGQQYRLILSPYSAEQELKLRTDATLTPVFNPDPFPRISPWTNWDGYNNTRQVNTEKLTASSGETAIADYSVYEAYNYCRTLTLNGYSDWYVPSSGEWSVVMAVYGNVAPRTGAATYLPSTPQGLRNTPSTGLNSGGALVRYLTSTRYNISSLYTVTLNTQNNTFPSAGNGEMINVVRPMRREII